MKRPTKKIKTIQEYIKAGFITDGDAMVVLNELYPGPHGPALRLIHGGKK